MKTDLENLMHTYGIDALLITGPAQHNPFMYYLTGGAHLTSADLIIRRASDPVLFHNAMEREEAAKTGFATKNITDYDLNGLLQQSNGNQLKATVLRYQKMLSDLGITSGRIALYGNIDAGSAYAIFSGIQEAMPDVQIVGEFGDSILMQAMATKDECEIERIRNMGNVTVKVVDKVADFLTSQKVIDGVLVKSGSNPLTIGDVKNYINKWLAELNAENPEGTIFSIGHEAGVPHSTGTPSHVLRLGETIVFDIFPCEAGGGYYYDFTRTWCLGYAPDEVHNIYNDVLDVYNTIIKELQVNTLCQIYQNRACILFEEKGHPTINSNPKSLEGYVHTLGHGLGLRVHERPWFGRIANEKDILSPGTVVTIEPGLYYPEKNIGVRLENTVWVRPDGKMEVLADYPMDLVLPIKHGKTQRIT